MALNSIRIGKIFGISIGLHWTFVMLLLFFLFFYPFAIFLVFLLLFVCVFIHEAAHAYTARRNNIKVREILLTPLGGLTSLDDENIDYKKEFNIAISGPLMSVFLGGISGLAAVFAPAGNIVFVFQELFVLNIALGVLNLLPAFPLDGGRVFRSYLEKRRDEFSATMLTVRLSKYVALLTVLGSIAYLYIANFSLIEKILDFVIFAFIGFILYGGAEAERQNAIVNKNVANLTIKDAIDRRFIFVKSATTIKNLYWKLAGKGTSVAITKDGGQFLFLDLLRKNVSSESTVKSIGVQVPQLKGNTDMVSAIRKIETAGRSLGVVVRHGKPIGIVTMQHLNAIISLRMMGQTDKISKTPKKSSGSGTSKTKRHPVKDLSSTL